LRIDFVRSAAKELEELDAEIQRRIVRFLRERIESESDPRRIGKALKGGNVPLWAYRVGDRRVVCAIEDKEGRILVLRVGHRRHVHD
jgi:mRNA interferase RelE/StbE